MMKQDVFKNCLLGLCKMNGVEVDDETLRMYYAKVKNDFTDDEFRAMANDILETENLYGKFPAPVLFYSRKKKVEAIDENSKQAEARQKFLDKVMDLATMSYVPKDWKEELNASLTPCASKALAEYGGFNAVWNAMHKGGEYNGDQEAWIVRDLTAKFNANYNAREESIKIEDARNDDVALQIADLTRFALKSV